MSTGLILTIGSLIFLILLLITYFLQERPSLASNKLYRQLLIIVIILLLTEIMGSYLFEQSGGTTLYYVILRIHWSTGIFWFTALYFYSVCFLKDINKNSIIELIKTDKRCKIYSIYSIICLIIYIFLPFKYMTNETFTYIPGTAAYFIVAYGVIAVALIIILMVKRRNEINARSKQATLIMLVELFIIFGFQLIYQQNAMIGLGAALQMYFLYFYIENPDLLMISSLEELKQEVERSSLAKSDFLSNMSHEIRSPMNAIVGFSETILDNPNYDEKSTKEDIENIANAGNNLLDIIDNILDISKIETGSEELEEKDYSISNVIIELSNIIETRLANKPVKFITDIDTQIPRKLYGDSTKVFQVLLNVLTNSIKYTEVGKIKLSLTKEIKNNNVTLKFKISDTGFGIKKEDFDKLFEKFSRLSSATKNEIEGTGLGLVITKKYVDLLGGKIWFESEYGVGTIFYVEIPQRIIDAEPIGDLKDATIDKENIEYFDCSGKKALVVDDNELNLKVTKKILEEYKFTVDTITGGKDCVYKIKAGEKYDIIFLDHMMPDMDGIRVVNIIKRLEDYHIPPVVALTANAITGAREMYLQEGFDEYLSKPINMSELNRIIKKYFNKNDDIKKEDYYD